MELSTSELLCREFIQSKEIMILYAIRRYHLDRLDAEDLVQISFAKAWENKKQYKAVPEVSFKSWLYTIMFRQFVNIYRKNKIEKTRKEIYFRETKWDTEMPFENIPTPHQYTTETVLESFNQLPEIFKKVCRMVLIDGKGYLEASIILDISIGTVKSRIHRGKRLLRKIIKNKGIKVSSVIEGDFA